MQTRVIKVQTEADIPAAAGEGAKVLAAGGLVGFPTETVYGIAAVASDDTAMERLRELKSRRDRPFSVHIGRPEDALRYVAAPPLRARRLMEKAWPGPLTILLPTGGELADPKLQDETLYARVCYNDTIGLRCPSDTVAARLLSAVDEPVVAPSANRAGSPSPRTGDEVLSELDGEIDLLIDAGATRYGRDSTIVLFNADGWRVVRRGVYDERAVRKMMRRRILFVCSGNTCRSPLAAGIARKLYAERLGCRVGELSEHGLEISSAGLSASEGSRPSEGAVAAAREYGADISRHRTRRATVELITGADVVLCMTEAQVAAVGRLARDVGKVRRLDPRSDVADPIGGDMDAYRGTARQIARAVGNLLSEGTL
ncbi:MAG: L-threonylcarbamoyladenylate synthase [Phycisphaerae bacterium]